MTIGLGRSMNRKMARVENRPALFFRPGEWSFLARAPDAWRGGERVVGL